MPDNNKYLLKNSQAWSYELPCWREGRDINKRGPERTRSEMGKAALFYPTQALYRQVNKATLVLSVLTHTITDVNCWITTQWPPLCDPLFHLLFLERIKTQKMGTFSRTGEWWSKRPSQSGDKREAASQPARIGRRGTREAGERTVMDRHF